MKMYTTTTTTAIFTYTKTNKDLILFQKQIYQSDMYAKHTHTHRHTFARLMWPISSSSSSYSIDKFMLIRNKSKGRKGERENLDASVFFLPSSSSNRI